jgi:hypothetical protein
MVLQAYKSHGFSKEYLQRIEKNNEKRKDLYIRIEKVFTKIFDKEPMKKVKKKKKEEEIVEPVEDEDIPPKSDEPEEEETLDVEPDEEDEVEEEYVSDGE